jgi:hypothetical protein
MMINTMSDMQMQRLFLPPFAFGSTNDGGGVVPEISLPQLSKQARSDDAANCK